MRAYVAKDGTSVAIGRLDPAHRHRHYYVIEFGMPDQTAEIRERIHPNLYNRVQVYNGHNSLWLGSLNMIADAVDKVTEKYEDVNSPEARAEMRRIASDAMILFSDCLKVTKRADRSDV